MPHNKNETERPLPCSTSWACIQWQNGNPTTCAAIPPVPEFVTSDPLDSANSSDWFERTRAGLNDTIRKHLRHNLLNGVFLSKWIAVRTQCSKPLGTQYHICPRHFQHMGRDRNNITLDHQWNLSNHTTTREHMSIPHQHLEGSDGLNCQLKRANHPRLNKVIRATPVEQNLYLHALNNTSGEGSDGASTKTGSPSSSCSICNTMNRQLGHLWDHE
ncbi:uncharacterized protein G2W53_026565 [Senna tora]|uniref:Uncharacterized protein n=1 Tax=Senna tora TaxID=362788 RepID=A0A834THN7_9FABA|nr:uncharacterized protein G2W53_026565 [Senna tora]